MSIVEFLETQFAEDEAVARAAICRCGGSTCRPETGWYHEPELIERLHDGIGQADRSPLGDSVSHVLRFDPARVLAEVEAKRQILEFHKNWPVLIEEKPVFEPVNPIFDLDAVTLRVTQKFAWITEREYVNRFGTQPPTDSILRAMASVYKGRPGWREEWE